jgi:hypothetical protein
MHVLSTCSKARSAICCTMLICASQSSQKVQVACFSRQSGQLRKVAMSNGGLHTSFTRMLTVYKCYMLKFFSELWTHIHTVQDNFLAEPFHLLKCCQQAITDSALSSGIRL